VILRDKGKLDISYIPPEAPCREREKEKLVSFVHSGGHAVLSGDIGTGKTLLAKQQNHDVYINCYSHKSEYKILEEILRQTRPTFSTAGLAPQRLWRELQGDHLIILDEIDGIIPEDIQHFTYTLSRQPEISQRIKYIAITRSYGSLKALIHDPAIVSTFAEKAVVQLEHYSISQIIEILEYRAKDSLHSGTYSPEILEFIAHIARLSLGHMRTGIDILRNSAIIAERHDHDIIELEDIREANQEGWISDLERIDESQALILLSVAFACRKKTYVTYEEIQEKYLMLCEGYNRKPQEKTIAGHLERLLNQEFIYKKPGGMDPWEYTILDYPAYLIIEKFETQFIN